MLNARSNFALWPFPKSIRKFILIRITCQVRVCGRRGQVRVPSIHTTQDEQDILSKCRRWAIFNARIIIRPCAPVRSFVTWNQQRFAIKSALTLRACRFTVPSVKILGDREVHANSGSSVTVRCLISNVLSAPSYVFWYEKKNDWNFCETTIITERLRFMHFKWLAGEQC